MVEEDCAGVGCMGLSCHIIYSLLSTKEPSVHIFHTTMCIKSLPLLAFGEEASSVDGDSGGRRPSAPSLIR